MVGVFELSQIVHASFCSPCSEIRVIVAQSTMPSAHPRPSTDLLQTWSSRISGPSEAQDQSVFGPFGDEDNLNSP